MAELETRFPLNMNVLSGGQVPKAISSPSEVEAVGPEAPPVPRSMLEILNPIAPLAVPMSPDALGKVTLLLSSLLTVTAVLL